LTFSPCHAKVSPYDGSAVGGDKDFVGGDKDLVAGDKDFVAGDKNFVAGDKNFVAGDKNFVDGDKNFVDGDKDLVDGDKDLVAGYKDLVDGDKDLVDGYKAFIVGDKNMRQEVFMPGTDWLPHREQDLVDLIAKWDASVSNAANRTKFGWNTDECSAVILKMGRFLDARGEYESTPTPENRLAKANAKAAAMEAMRSFANSSIRFNGKMSDTDKLALGVYTPDPKPTPKPDPTDLVGFEFSTIPSDHRVVVTYRIAGSTKRGKGPYHAAEIRYWVRALDAATPLDANEDGWHSVVNTASPWKKSFPGADAGKRLFVMMRWENSAVSGEDDSGKGPWSGMEHMIRP
jgi:hypothetical protein